MAAGGWWLVAVGGWWELAVGGWWFLGAVLKGGPQQKKTWFLNDRPALRAVLNEKKKKLLPKGTPWGVTPPPPTGYGRTNTSLGGPPPPACGTEAPQGAQWHILLAEAPQDELLDAVCEHDGDGQHGRGNAREDHVEPEPADVRHPIGFGGDPRSVAGGGGGAAPDPGRGTLGTCGIWDGGIWCGENA